MVSPEILENIIITVVALGLSFAVVAAIGLMVVWFNNHI